MSTAIVSDLYPHTQPLAAIYCRVSTEDQARGYSLPTQREACLRYAREHGYHVPAHYMVTEDASGTTLDRPGLQHVRDLVRTRGVAAVIVYDVDRLSRNLGHQLLLVEESERVGVRLCCVTQTIEHGAEGHMVFQLKGVFAEYERAKIRERTRRGSIGRAQAGHPGGGRVPYGYIYISEPHAGAWVIDEEAAAVVRTIFGWCVQGRTTRAIARLLTEHGYRTPAQREQASSPDQAPRPWSQQTVAKILTNATYTGEAHWNKHQRVSKTTYTHRNKAEWVPFTVPVIIDAETFARTQQALATRKQTARRNRKHDYLLSGKRLRCGRCGRHMMQLTRFGVGWYRCGSYLLYAGAGPRCKGSVKISKIDAYVWEQVERILRNPERLLPIAEHQWGHATERQEQARYEISLIEAALGKLDREGKRWAEAYALEVISLDELKAWRSDIAKRQEPLHQDLQRWQATLGDTAERLELLADIIPTIKHVWKVMTEPISDDEDVFSEENKRFFVDLFDVRATWSPGETPAVTINLTPGMEVKKGETIVTTAPARCSIPCT